MAEGLEVTIKYRGEKYNQVASPATPSSGFAILKKDLAHLRVHSPSQRNVQRVGGSFILHWPTAGTSPKVAGLADSLHMRWFKLCSDDPEALKLREFLSIESITLIQDGVTIRSTAGPEQASQDAPPGTLAERLSDPLPEMAQQPAPVPVPVPILSLPVKPPPPSIPPPRVPPSAPRLDRQQPPHLKRRMSGVEGPSNLTRQKLDVSDEPTTTPPLRSIPAHPPTSPRADRQRRSSTPGGATKAFPQSTRDDATHVQTPTAPRPPEPQTVPPSPPREPGEIHPVPIPTHVSSPPALGSDSGSALASASGTRPPPTNHATLPAPVPAPAPPYPNSSLSGNDDPRRRDRDVSRLTRELWDTRRELRAMQAREQVILDDLERLGPRPESTAGTDRNGVSRDELVRLEAELRAERGRRVRAERALSDVERECRTPFVVPALFQAFMSISELSN